MEREDAIVSRWRILVEKGNWQKQNTIVFP